jgi:hypothetical protein
MQLGSAIAGTGGEPSMAYNLVEAGAAAGRSKSSILRAIRRGALSAAQDDTTGSWRIEEAELFRAFPPSGAERDGTARGTSRNRGGTPTIRELQARLDAKDALIAAHESTIDDLRKRLDTMTALLTDQRPARGWWARLRNR